MTDNDSATQSIDLGSFAINEEGWVTLREVLSTTTDLMLLEDTFEVMGELELQLAYTLHVIEGRQQDLR